MNYIEISDGLSVRIDEIESVNIADDGLTSIVRTHHNIYKSTFSYAVLLQLLERNPERDKIKEEKSEQMLNILKQIGTPAW